jgi:HlyD family secretion protein
VWPQEGSDGQENTNSCGPVPHASEGVERVTTGRWILTGILLVAVGIATYHGLQPRPPPRVEVSTAAARRGNVTRTVTAAGHLQARETVKVSSNVTGDLLSLSVKEGDHVARGQVLGQIDKRLEEATVAQFRGAVASAKAQIAQAEATLAQDQRELERVRVLVWKNLASASELEKAQTQVKVDSSRLDQQRELVAQNEGQLGTALYNLSRSTLTAPIDGTVLELQHKVGERIRGSDFSEDVVMLMGGLTDMEVKAEVGEHEVVGIHVGDESTVEIDAIPDKQFKGHVVAVGRNAQIKNPGTDAEVTTFFVRVGLDVPPEGALPGMSSAVAISTATHDNVIMVPIQAVTSREPKSAKGPPREGEMPVADRTASGRPRPVKVVFVVDKDGTARMREVHTGLASRTDVEVLEGVGEGEPVVEGPYRTLARELQDGQKVTEPKKDEKGDAAESARAGAPDGPQTSSR